MGKRCFDIIVAAVTLSVLALPMALVALIIRCDSAGPALFRQERVGRHGRSFMILKFRTMKVDAETTVGGSQLTMAGDERITRTGRWLRTRRVDEWPQLFNVLRGDMSLVGPRPEVPRYVAHYPAAQRALVLAVRPGVTDPAALAFRDEGARLAASADPERCYIEEILPAKLALQVAYAQQASLWSDIRVLCRTGLILFSRMAAVKP